MSGEWRPYALPVGLTTGGVLLLELALARLFSVVLFYHYAFLVLSIAMLGLGAGAVLARLSPPRPRPAFGTTLARALVVAALLVVPLLALVLTTNVWLVTGWVEVRRLALLFVVGSAPLVLAGYTIAAAMAAAGTRVAPLYAVDLVGASIGCIAFVLLAAPMDAPALALTAGAAWCAAAWSWGRLDRGRGGLPAVAIGAVLLLGAAAATTGSALLDVRYTRGARVENQLFAAWNSFSRVSVHREGNGYWLKLDGGAGSWLSTIDVEGESGRQAAAAFGRTGPEIAFWLADRPRVLVIGAGGGWDVARALLAGSPDVTAVEINPIIARDIMGRVFREHTAGLYHRPDVHVVIEDGRSFAGRPGDPFDVIQLSQVDTWAGSAAGSYALTENYLYTTEAIAAYLRRLTPDGLLSITRWEFPQPRETLRLLAITLAALEEHGAADPARHVLVALEPLGPDGPWTGTVVVRPRPFETAEVERLRRHLAGSAVRFGHLPDRRLTGAFSDLAHAADRDAFLLAYPYDVRPVHDDRPFFFFTGRWSHLLDGIRGRDTADAVNTGAQFLLVALMVIAILAVIAFLLAPLVLTRRRPPPGSYPHFGYAVAVGLGFIIIEVVLIQRFAMTLGSPAHALTVVLFGILLASGLGALLSGRLPERNLVRGARGALALVALIALFYASFLGGFLLEIQRLGTVPRFLLTGLFIAVPGVLMGAPFPSGLRLTAAFSRDAVEWAWALNAAASVLGSVAAIFVAVIAGYSWALVLAAAAYATAALLLGRMAASRGPGAEGTDPA